MDKLIRIFAQPIGFAGTAFGIAGLIYLGISLASGGRRQPEIVKAIAMIAAGFKDGMQGGGGQLAGAIAMIVGGGIVIAASVFLGSLDTSFAG